MTFAEQVQAIAARMTAEAGADREVYCRAWLEATGIPAEEAVMTERILVEDGMLLVRRIEIRRRDEVDP